MTFIIFVKTSRCSHVSTTSAFARATLRFQRALLFSKIGGYLPYFSFPYRSIHRKMIPAEFHKITGIRLSSAP